MCIRDSEADVVLKITPLALPIAALKADAQRLKRVLLAHRKEMAVWVRCPRPDESSRDVRWRHPRNRYSMDYKRDANELGSGVRLNQDEN